MSPSRFAAAAVLMMTGEWALAQEAVLPPAMGRAVIARHDSEHASPAEMVASNSCSTGCDTGCNSGCATRGGPRLREHVGTN